MTGFVVAGKTQGEFGLARYTIACCAADAQVARLRVVGVSSPTTGVAEVWVEVDGTYERPIGPHGLSTLRATAPRASPCPTNLTYSKSSGPPQPIEFGHRGIVGIGIGIE